MSSEDNISILPDLPLKHFLKKLDYISILKLSEVSDRLHDFIDKEKLKLHLDGIRIKVQPEKVELSLSFNEERNRSRQISIEYQKEKMKWEDRWNEKKVDIGGEAYLDDFCKDLHTILKHQKNVLKVFSFKIKDDHPGQNEMKMKRICCRFFTELRDSLITRTHPLQVVDFGARAIGHEQVIQVMKYFDPKILRTIQLTNFLLESFPIFDIDAIIDLDQFKQTEEFHLENFQTSFSESIQAFGHLSRFDISLDSITTDDLVILKEALLLSKKFERCCIAYNHYDDQDFSKLSAQPFKQREMLGERTRWILQAPDSDRALSLTTDYGAMVFINIPSLSRSQFRFTNVEFVNFVAL